MDVVFIKFSIDQSQSTCFFEWMQGVLTFSPKYRSVCETCFKEFETEAMLRIHLKYAHGQNTKMAKQLEQLNKCKKCNKTCTSESQLSLHTSLYCDVSYSCDFCPSVFNQIKVEYIKKFQIVEECSTNH